MIRYLVLSWLSFPSTKAFVCHHVDGRVLTLLEAHRKPTKPYVVSKSAATTCALVGVLCVGVIASGGPNIQPAVATYSQTLSEASLPTPAISILINEDLVAEVKAAIKAELNAEQEAVHKADRSDQNKAYGVGFTFLFALDQYIKRAKPDSASLDALSKVFEFAQALTVGILVLASF
jgi:hypothetical protein